MFQHCIGDSISFLVDAGLIAANNDLRTFLRQYVYGKHMTPPHALKAYL